MHDQPLYLERIELLFHYRDGTRPVVIRGRIDIEPTPSWQQWGERGATHMHLTKNVALLEALANTVRDGRA